MSILENVPVFVFVEMCLLQAFYRGVVSYYGTQ